MFRFKIFISIIIFSTFLILTSLIKNETREVEKKIFNLSLEINLKEKDFVESQLDFSYLTSPAMIENKIEPGVQAAPHKKDLISYIFGILNNYSITINQN